MSYNPAVTIPPIQMIPAFLSDTTQNRKRSFSVVEGMENTSESARGNRLSSISSILNPEQQQQRGSTGAEDPSLDPHLHRRNLSQGSTYQSPPQLPPSQARSEYQPRPGPGGVGAMGATGGIGAMDYEDSGSGGSGSSAIANLERSTRKARLKREAEAMRAMLEAKEKELQELDGAG